MVGAGLGGLATALRLAHRGHHVTVLEKTARVGGRNRRLRVGEAEFDAGPTLLMMLDPFRKLFADVGERLEDHLPIVLCDPSYRVFYADGTVLDGTPNVARMIQQIERLSGVKDAAAYPRFLGSLAELYHDAIPNFVRNPYSKPRDFLSPRGLGLVARHRMLGNLARRVERTFDDPRLQMLFSFQTMYLGLSPYDAPWVYATLAYMEYGEGIWYPEGGVASIAESIANLARSRGAEIRLECPVARVEGRTVVLESGERLEPEAVIINADLPYAKQALEGRVTKPRRLSCSAFMIYMDYEGELPGLEHHNVFFGRDFKGNLDAIFRDKRMPEDPAFYACISSKSERSRARPGGSNLYALVPCPNLAHPFGEADACALQSHVFQRLQATAGFDPAKVRAKQVYGPRDWESDLNLAGGAAFGLSHDLFQSAFFRPGNRSRDNRGVYYVGASTIPGNGMPMVLISAELAERRLEEDGYLA